MSEDLHEQRWLVGLDLRPHSHGAINFARWLAARDQAGSMRLDGLHVIPEHLLELPTAPARAQLVGNAERATRATLEARGADEAFRSLEIVISHEVVDTLAAAGELPICAGLIIGRRSAGEDPLSIVQLGKVARRLLRRLSAPTFVVPADLELAHIGRGPIVCAVTLDDAGVTLARYAESFAALCGCELRLVHVVSGGDPVGLQYLPAAAWDDLHARERDASSQALKAWRDAAGLSAATALVQGRVVPKLISAARELDACMILTGSRRLSLAERVWMSSVSSGLAAASHLPVGVVPNVS